MNLCTVCGEPIEVGDFPCITTPRPHARGMYAAIGDECDILQTTGTKEPIRFRSKQDRLRWLKAHGYREVVKNAGPDDKHCARWAITDPQTLENGRILVSRPGALQDYAPPPPVKMRIQLVSGEGRG